MWRCEQGWERINGWHNFGFAELIRIEVTPAPNDGIEKQRRVLMLRVEGGDREWHDLSVRR